MLLQTSQQPHYTAYCVTVATVHCCARPPIFRTEQKEEASCKQDYHRQIRSSAPINKIKGRTDMNPRRSNNRFSYYQNRNACSGLLIVLRFILWFPMYCFWCSVKYFCFEVIEALILTIRKNNPVRDCIISLVQGFWTESHDFQLNWKEILTLLPQHHTTKLFLLNQWMYVPWSDAVTQRNVTYWLLTNWDLA